MWSIYVVLDRSQLSWQHVKGKLGVAHLSSHRLRLSSPHPIILVVVCWGVMMSASIFKLCQFLSSASALVWKCYILSPLFHVFIPWYSQLSSCFPLPSSHPQLFPGAWPWRGCPASANQTSFTINASESEWFTNEFIFFLNRHFVLCCPCHMCRTCLKHGILVPVFKSLYSPLCYCWQSSTLAPIYKDDITN